MNREPNWAPIDMTIQATITEASAGGTRRSRPRRNAGLQPAVARVFNLLYRRFPIGRASGATVRLAGCNPALQQIEHLRCAGRVSSTHELSGLAILLRRSASSSKPRQTRARAFTLIELLLVLVILGVLAAVVVPKFSGRTEQARVTAAQTQIATFGTALDAFEVDTGGYPQGRNGLQDLVIAPRDAQSWKGPYLKGEVPLDPWGNAYIYECPGKHNPNGYDLMSTGKDGREGGDDDITNWQQATSRPQR